MRGKVAAVPAHLVLFTHSHTCAMCSADPPRASAHPRLYYTLAKTLQFQGFCWWKLEGVKDDCKKADRPGPVTSCKSSARA